MKILLTGATGFLGSHMAENLIANNYELILTKRENSSLTNCQSFYSNVIWVNTDSESWKQQVIDYKPEFIIHTAWDGVSASKRDDWKNQLTNIDLMYELLIIAKRCEIYKFISLGSQAEYGQFEGKITEDYPLNPTTSYGAVKLAVLEMLRIFCIDNSINWYWLRVFSVFGERENEKWIIPALIKTMLSEKTEMNFTKGEQKYSYIYVGDLAKAITKVVSMNAPSGIYNISSNQVLCLKDLITMIKNLVNPDFKLNFGTIPYRVHQSMHIEGDTKKFSQYFGEIDTSDFRIKLEKVVNSYRNQ